MGILHFIVRKAGIIGGKPRDKVSLEILLALLSHILVFKTKVT